MRLFTNIYPNLSGAYAEEAANDEPPGNLESLTEAGANTTNAAFADSFFVGVRLQEHPIFQHWKFAINQEEQETFSGKSTVEKR